MSEEVTSVLEASEEVLVGISERTGILSVLKLVCWEVVVSTVLLRKGVDGTFVIPEESVSADKMVACAMVAVGSWSVGLDGSWSCETETGGFLPTLVGPSLGTNAV